MESNQSLKKGGLSFGLSADTFAQMPSSFTSCDENLFPKNRNASPTSNRMAPLLGKKIFLHYEPGALRDRKVELTLRKLKADLVDFFSRDVDYVITSRSQKSMISTLSPDSKDDVSPVSLKSTTISSTHGDSAFSSLKTPKLNSGKPINTVTRGRAMLMAARKATGTSASEVGQTTSAGSLPSSVLRQLQPTTATLSNCVNKLSSSMSTEKIATAPSTDLLSRARQLGIKIITMETVMKWIRNLPSDVQSYIQSIQRIDIDDTIIELPEDPERDRVYEVRLLAPPCIKIIDMQNQTRPLYLDHTEYLSNLWNLISKPKSKFQLPTDKDGTSTNLPPTQAGIGLTTNSGSVPIPSLNMGQNNLAPGPGAQPILIRQNSRSRKKYERLRKQTRITNQSQRMTSTQPQAEHQNGPAADGEPSGYCECCSLSFKNLFEHMHSVDHVQFANNTENYRLLDDVLEKLPTIQEFLHNEAIHPYSDLDTSLNRKKLVGQKRKNRGFTSKPNTVPAVEVVPEPKERITTEIPSPAVMNLPDTPPVLNIPETNFSQSVLLANEAPPLFSADENSSGTDKQGDKSKIGSHLSNICDSVHALLEVIPKEPEASIQIVSEYHETSQKQPNTPNENDHEFIPDLGHTNTLGLSPRLGQPVTGDLVQAWQSVCSCISATTKSAPVVESLESIPNQSPKSSPLLQLFHKKCLVCSRSHIPNILRPDMQLPISTILGPSYQFDGAGCNGGLYLQGEHSSNLPTPSNSADSSKSFEREIPVLSPAYNIEPFQNSKPLESPVFESRDSVPCDDQNPYSTYPDIPLLSCESTLPTSPMKQTKVTQLDETRSSYSSRNCSPSANLSLPTINCNSDSANTKSPSSFVSQDHSSEGHYSLRSKRKRHHLSFIGTPNYQATDCSEIDPNSSTSQESVDKNLNSDPLTRAFKLGQLPLELPSKISPISSQPIRACSRANRTNLNSGNPVFQKSSIHDSTVLCNLPVLKRAKFIGKRTLVTTDSDESELDNCKSISMDESHDVFSVNPYFTSPQHKRSTRMAALVARESISLSVKALFSPSGLDRQSTFFERDDRKQNLSSLKHSSVLSESMKTLSTEPSRIPNDKQSTDSSYSPWDLIPGSTESRLVLRRHFPRHSSSFFSTPKPIDHQQTDRCLSKNQAIKRTLFPAVSTPGHSK